MTKANKVGGLTVEQLSVVHATKYKPTISEEGTLSIPTTFDAIGGLEQNPADFVFRNTVHTSLNGVVSSHMMGNWDDVGYVVVSPFMNAVEENGPPSGFCTVDTYWALDAETPLKLTDYKLISPSIDVLESGEFYEEDGNIIYYQTQFDDDDRLRFLTDFLVQNDPDYNRYCPDEKLKFQVFDRFGAELEKKGVLKNSTLYIETEENIETLQGIVLSASDEDKIIIDSVIRQQIRDVAVHAGLACFESPVKTIGKDYWCDDGQNQGESDMANHVGANHFGKHIYSAQHKLEEMLNGQTMLGFTTISSVEDVTTFIDENFDELPAPSIEQAKQLLANPLYEKARSFRNDLINKNEASSPKVTCEYN